MIGSYILQKWQEMGSERGMNNKQRRATGQFEPWTASVRTQPLHMRHTFSNCATWAPLRNCIFKIQFCLEIDLPDFCLQKISQWDTLSSCFGAFDCTICILNFLLLKLLNLVRESDWYQQLTDWDRFYPSDNEAHEIWSKASEQVQTGSNVYHGPGHIWLIVNMLELSAMLE